MELRIAAEIVAAALAEVGEAPEEALCAGLMAKGGSREDFYAVRTWLLVVGLAEEAPGPVLVANQRLLTIHRKARDSLRSAGV